MNTTRGPALCHVGCCQRLSNGWPGGSLVARCQRNRRGAEAWRFRDDDFPNVSDEDDYEDRVPRDLAGSSFRRREPPPPTTTSTTSSCVSGLVQAIFPRDPHDDGGQGCHGIGRSVVPTGTLKHTKQASFCVPLIAQGGVQAVTFWVRQTPELPAEMVSGFGSRALYQESEVVQPQARMRPLE